MPAKTTARSAKKTVKPRAKKTETVVEKTNLRWNAPRRILRIVDRRFKDKVNDITVALVLYDDGSLGLGFSKLNPVDKYDRRTAVRTAVKRAQPNISILDLVDF